MASLDHSRQPASPDAFAVAYEGWRRLQRLSGQAVDLPPGPDIEAIQDSAFEACEQAERALLELAPRSDGEVVALIEVLLGNEEVAALGGPVLRRIQTYLSPASGMTHRRRRTAPRPDGRAVLHRAEARFR